MWSQLTIFWETVGGIWETALVPQNTLKKTLAKYKKTFEQMSSEVSSVRPAQSNERTTNVVVDSSSPFQTQLWRVHGRQKDFFQEGTIRRFIQNFSRGTKSGFVFFPSKLTKQPFLVKFSKSRGPCPSLPTPMVEFTMITRFMHQFSKRCNGWQKVDFCGKLA